MEALIPISIMLGAFAMIFGMRYLSNKEKMAMIERGINPGIGQAAPKPFISLKFGLLLVGLGFGLLIALLIVQLAGLGETIRTNNGFRNDGSEVAVYFGCIGMFGGFGLIASYIIEKKWLDKQ